MWLIILSDQLLIVALVSRYLTNKLIRRGTIQEWPKPFTRRSYAVLAIVSNGYSPLLGRFPRVTHPSATKGSGASPGPSFDLHVLDMPPAFILSQDQTLKLTFSDACASEYLSPISKHKQITVQKTSHEWLKCACDQV